MDDVMMQRRTMVMMTKRLSKSKRHFVCVCGCVCSFECERIRLGCTGKGESAFQKKERKKKKGPRAKEEAVRPRGQKEEAANMLSQI